jgi:hypothetical protein
MTMAEHPGLDVLDMEANCNEHNLGISYACSYAELSTIQKVLQ